MYGEQIKNVSDGTDLADAVNYGQLQTVSAQILSANVKIDTLSTNVTALTSELNSKVSIDGNNAATLSICHVSRDEYHDIVLNSSDEEISNTIYIISADNYNAYGKRITNLSCLSTELSDAATVGYVNNKVTDNKNEIKEIVNTLYDSLSSNGISGGVDLSNISMWNLISAVCLLANKLSTML